MQDIVDMLQALPHAVTPGPAGPDLAAADVARGQRVLRQRRRRRLAGVAGTVAVGAAAVVLVATSAPRSAAPAAVGVTSGAHPASTGASAGSANVQLPLVTLAANVAAEPRPAGDATLVERETGAPGQAGVNVWDLYTDDGRYFFSRTEAGLPAQVNENNNQGDGMFGLEVAAAEYAATGDLDTAALKMAWAQRTPVPAWLSAQVKNISAGGLQIDNYVWESCEDALVAGSGNPQVRAGVLRLVSVLPGITVTHGTTDGQPTLTLTAGKAELGAVGIDKADPKVETGPAYQEAITINASTGIPLQIASGPAGKVTGTVTYVVTRVSLAGIASGKF
ncbi:MAG TPA: hypothetical protein VHZ03_07430 [Trebonia sp.]|nr:hypothetical protein [Trebonia sp.]